jgi:hypothetical protein
LPRHSLLLSQVNDLDEGHLLLYLRLEALHGLKGTFKLGLFISRVFLESLLPIFLPCDI